MSSHFFYCDLSTDEWVCKHSDGSIGYGDTRHDAWIDSLS